MKTPHIFFASTLFLTLSLPALAAEPETHHVDTGKGELLVHVETSQLMGSVAKGATRVPLAVLNLSASCDADIRIESLEVAHTGLGAVSDISAVYLTDGFRRISRARTFDSRSRTADLRFPSLVIPKCGAVRLTAVVDIATDAEVASEHGLTVMHASVIRSSAADTILSFSDDTQLVVTRPKQSGSITVNFLPVNGLLRYGRVETLARLQVTADSKNHHLLQSILLTNQEDARDMDFTRLQLETRSGDVVTTTAARMKGKTVKLDFSPTYILERGRTQVFLLRATVNGSQRRKANFHLEEKGDLEAVLYRPR